MRHRRDTDSGRTCAAPVRRARALDVRRAGRSGPDGRRRGSRCPATRHGGDVPVREGPLHRRRSCRRPADPGRGPARARSAASTAGAESAWGHRPRDVHDDAGGDRASHVRPGTPAHRARGGGEDVPGDESGAGAGTARRTRRTASAPWSSFRGWGRGLWRCGCRRLPERPGWGRADTADVRSGARRAELVRLLLARGADVEVRSAERHTASTLATGPEVMLILREAREKREEPEVPRRRGVSGPAAPSPAGTLRALRVAGPPGARSAITRRGT